MTDHIEPTTGAAFEFEAHTLTAAQQIRATALRVAADWCVNNGDLDEVLDVADRWADWLANGSREVGDVARLAAHLPTAPTGESS